MKQIIITNLFLFSFFNVFSQDTARQKVKFFIEGGFGAAGSFAVIDYSDFSPIQGTKVFVKKRFLGSAQNISAGLTLKNNWEVRGGLNYQHFTKWVKSVDTLRNAVEVYIDRDIQHRDYMWYASGAKKIRLKRNYLSAGIGLYYLVSKVQRIEIYPGYVIDKEKIWKGAYDGEGGLFAEFGYEYRFQPKVSLGLKSQFYYTLSLVYPESVTLYPYVKILF